MKMRKWFIVATATMMTVALLAACRQPTDDPPGRFGISLSPSGLHEFDELWEGYTPAQATALALTVSITNTGNQPTGELTLALSGENLTAFVLNPATTIPGGAPGTFTVTPAHNLGVGIHTATVTVTGGNNISASLDLSFEVTPDLSLPPRVGMPVLNIAADATTVTWAAVPNAGSFRVYVGAAESEMVIGTVTSTPWQLDLAPLVIAPGTHRITAIAVPVNLATHRESYRSVAVDFVVEVPACCVPGCDCDGDCGTADCDCEDVPPSIVLVGAPGTVDRTGVEKILGDVTGMASLFAADHFAAVGVATMVTRDGYVFVHSIANNASGLRVLPAALAGLQAGDMLRATGRTTGAVTNSRLELAHIGAGAGAGLGNEAVHPGSANDIPEVAFTFNHILTQGDITNGLRIAPNGWSWPSTPGTPAEWTARFGDFAFSIDDLIVFRPEVLAQHIDFNLAGNEAFQVVGRTDLDTTGLTLAGTATATIHRYDNRNFVHIGSRTANWHGLNVTGLRAGVTQTIRVTGRTSGDWPTSNGSLEFIEGGSGSLSFGAIAAGDGTFTLTGTVSEASTSFRIAVNNYNAGTDEAELSGRTSFYIYSIIVGTDLGQPAADPADTVNVAEVEDFWPGEITVDTTALEAALADAEIMIGTAVGAANGDAVLPTDYWVPLAVFDALYNAIAAAQAVLDDPAATQEDVDEALADLETAYEAFGEARLPGLLDPRAALYSVLNQANLRDEADYTAASWATFLAARTAAQTAHGNPAATPAELNAAREALEEAMAALVRAYGTSTTITFAEFSNPITTALEVDMILGDGDTLAVSHELDNVRWYRGALRITEGVRGVYDEILYLDDVIDRVGRHLITVRADRNGRTYSRLIAVRAVNP